MRSANGQAALAVIPTASEARAEMDAALAALWSTLRAAKNGKGRWLDVTLCERRVVRAWKELDREKPTRR